MKELARPNEFKDTPMLERWVCWCQPDVWLQWKQSKMWADWSFWRWMLMEYPDLLGTFKKLTWEG